MRDYYAGDGSPLNQSIKISTKGKAPHDWAGNIIVVKHAASSDVVMDACAEDLKHAMDYFIGYGRGF
jgi:hypothetical protein